MGFDGVSAAQRGWPIVAAPRRQVAYLILVELAVAAWSAFELESMAPRAGEWARAAMLVGLAVVFEEAAKRSARLRLRIGAELRQDMTSVWTLAAAIALPRGLAVAVIISILTFVWLRQERPSGAPLYAMMFNTANFVGSCLGASVAAHAVFSAATGLVPAVAMTLAILSAVATFALVNRLLVTGGLIAAAVRGRALVGSLNDNLIEFATLCLGGLVAAVVVHEPWLTVLAIAPLFALQRGALVNELETAATVDTKTGLLNAVAWEHVAQRELARATRTRSPLAVLLIDIDRFKLVNDEFGHLVGDKVLREVGRCLAAGVREYDSVGRFGGEEFVAVLPEAEISDALVIAERLRSRVNAMLLADLTDGVGADQAELSISIGVSYLSSGELELSDLLREADAALYRAKRAGRNRVMLADAEGGTGPDARLPLA